MGAFMNKPIPENLGSVSGQFTEMLPKLVQHRGLSAEAEIIDALTLERLTALYEGAEPKFSEVIECSNILRVPVSVFLLKEPGTIREFETAFGEMLFYSARMPENERAEFAVAFSKWVSEYLTSKGIQLKAGDDPELPDTLISLIRKATD